MHSIFTMVDIQYILTYPCRLMEAPASRRRRTTSLWPLRLAKHRAVSSIYCNKVKYKIIVIQPKIEGRVDSTK